MTFDNPSQTETAVPEWALPTGADEGLDGKNSVREELQRICKSLKVWHSSNGDAYVTLPGKGHFPVRTKPVRSWLQHRYYVKHQRAAYAKAVDEAIEQLEARAIHAGEQHEPCLRVAEHGGAVYLDLAGQTGQAVEMTGNGWQVTNDPPVRFVRPANMRALPMPSADGDINDLRPFINVANEDDFRLIVACLVGYLRPSGPYPILVLNGEQGSAKTTLTRVVRRLIDPNETDIRSPRSNERDLAAAGRNNWVLAYDNLSRLPPYMADSFCRLSTGISFAGRALYTDFDEAAITLCRPVILNGISELASRPDLLDRSIVVRLPSIQPENRKTEKEFWEEFEAARPSILGALCDATSAALANWEAVELTTTPRMADFVRWVAAAAPSFGLSADDILGAYERNRQAAVSDMLASDIVAHVLLMEIGKKREIEGTPTELFMDLKERARALELDKSYGFPKAPNALSGALRRLEPALRDLGITVERGREGPDGQRMIRIWREEDDAELSSTEPSLN